MQTLLAAVALVAFATPSVAMVWADPVCASVLRSDNGTFTYRATDGSLKSVCQIASWPADEPMARLSCDTGETIFLYAPTVDGPVMFGSLPMYPVGHAQIKCPEGKDRGFESLDDF